MLQARHEDGISSGVADIEDALLLPQLGPIPKGGCRPEDYWGPNKYKLVEQIGGVDLDTNHFVLVAAHYRLLLLFNEFVVVAAHYRLLLPVNAFVPVPVHNMLD